MRGVMGMYLASSPDWGAENVLSAEAWKKGLIGKEKVVELFGVEVMREREHETMKGVRVGEVRDEGGEVVEGLVRMFGDVGRRAEGLCVGEEVLRAVKKAREIGGDGEGKGREFAEAFAGQVS